MVHIRANLDYTFDEMPAGPNNTFEIRTDAEWKLVESETWTDIYSGLSRHGAQTAAELARLVGRTRQNVYFHLAKLETAGLVRVVGERPANRKPESVYDLTTREVRLVATPEDPESMDRLVSLYQKLMRSTARAFGHASDAGVLEMDRERRDWIGFKVVARLTRAERLRVLELLREIDTIMNQPEEPMGGELWTVAGFSIPLVRKGARSPEPGDDSTNAS